MNALEYAIQMELDGEKFYREQAMKNKEGTLKPVFLSMANDEKKHAEVIRKKQLGKDLQVPEADMASKKNVFSEAIGLESEKNSTKQLDAYEIALEMEKKSIALYKSLLSESSEDKDVFEFLIKQEEEHFKLIEEIVIMVRQPEQWVESAMFGLRKEY